MKMGDFVGKDKPLRKESKWKGPQRGEPDSLRKPK